MLAALAGLAHARRRLVLAGAVVFLALAGIVGGPVASLLTVGPQDLEASSYESVRARERLQDAAGRTVEPSMIVLLRAGVDVDSEPVAARMRALAATIQGDPAVVATVTYAETRSPALVSRDGRSTYIPVYFRPLPTKDAQDAAKRIEEALADERDVVVGGSYVVYLQIDDQVGKDLARAELLALPLLVVLSMLVFRGVVAALLPVAVGIVALLGAFLVLRIVNAVTPLSVYALNLVTGLGLGLAIDYSLFIVSRYREELARLGPGPEALVRTLTTAGRTVVFSALTVAAALASLLVFPQRFLFSMGTGGIAVALTAAAAALIVLPAVLAMLGTRVNALSPGPLRRRAERAARPDESGAWYRLAEFVMRRPVPVATLTSVLLLALGLPFLGVKFVGIDASALPESASARQVDDALRTEFPRSSSTYAAVSAPASARAEVDSYVRRLGTVPGVASVAEPRYVAAETWRIDVVPGGSSFADETKRAVEAARELDAPFEVRFGGDTASFLDQQESLAGRLPVALAILGVTTLVLLFLMTGSVVLPLKSLLMNLLTVVATFGVLVVVFQHGRLEGLLDYESFGALDLTQPILIGCVAFALSTDYGVFLLTRIREAIEAGMSNTEAVATGLERTGRIVTAAAVLFCAALGAFSTSEIVFVKQIGVGIVVAVLLDATIVRALLVPALMKLLGDWNWWAPRPLRRLHDRIGVLETGT